MKKNFYIQDYGTIIMETLLSLPIYFIILAGTFWLGEICISRLTLNHGEKIRLWESGNRHSTTGIADNDIFYFLNTDNSSDDMDVMQSYHRNFSGISNFPATSNNNRWGQIRTGQATLNIKRSIWSWGTTEASINVNKSGYNSTIQQQSYTPILSRDDASSVQLYSRTNDNSRVAIYNNNFNDNRQWLRIYQEQWPSITPGGGSANVLSQYNRNRDYLDWSE